jgi:hypothetical protein
MPLAASIEIDDGQATPVAHTFVPQGPDQRRVWSFEDQSGGVAIGNSELTLRLEDSVQSQSGPLQRVHVGCRIPVLEVATGSSVGGYEPPPKLAYFCDFKGTFIVPMRATADVKADIRAYVANLMDTAVVNSMVVNGEAIWG